MIFSYVGKKKGREKGRMEGRKEGRKDRREEGMKERRKVGWKEVRSLYICNCVCKCEMKHATVGQLGLFLA